MGDKPIPPSDTVKSFTVYTPAYIKHLFTYHQPTADQLPLFTKITQAAEAFALVIAECTPPGPGQTIAIQHVVDARMRANMAIATSVPKFPQPVKPGVIKNET